MEELFEKRREIHKKMAELTFQYAEVESMILEEREKCPHKKEYFTSGHPYGFWSCERCHKFIRSD